MSFVVTPYVLAQSASALISVFVAAVAWRRRGAPAGLLFALMMTCVAIWTAAVSLEEAAVGVPMKVLFSKVSYLGAVNVAPLLLLFAWKFRHGDRRFGATVPLLWIVPAGVLALAATNELHGLVWSSVTLDASSPNNLAVYGHGPAWWVLVGYDLLVVIAATVLFGRASFEARRVFARQSAIVIAAVAVVWGGLALYVAPGNPVPGFDLPAASFAFAGLMILWGLTREGFLALSPIAREALVDAMVDGLIVEDARGRVVDANPKALSLLHADSSVAGTSLARMLEKWPELAAAIVRARAGGADVVHRDARSYEVTVTALRGRQGDERGRMMSLRDVTERLRAEEAFRESERSLNALLSAARRQATELALIDKVRTSIAKEVELPVIYRTVVEGIARAFGYTQVSLYLLEDGVLVLQHQVGYSRVLQRIPITQGIMSRVIRNGRSELIENVRTDPDFIGAIEGLMSEVCVPLIDQGTPVGVLNVESTNGVVMGGEDFRLMTVIGEHVSIAFTKARLYAEARSNEERYRALVSTLGEGVALVDLSERFAFANPAAETVFGVPPGTLAGRSLAEFLTPAELARSAEETEKRRQGESSTYEQVITRPDGEKRQIELIATPRRSESGEVIGTTGVFRDVTEIKQLHERLEQERALLLTLIDNLPDYIFLKDTESRFILTNMAQANLVGASDPKELVGKSDRDFVPRELADQYRRGDQHVMQSRAPIVNVEESSVSHDGSVRKVLTTKVPVFDAEGQVTGVVGISRDVTGILQAEEERDRLQEQLQQSQKMEAVGRLAGGIAHDFNNILTVILGYCEVSLEEARGNRALEGNLNEIKRAAQRSASLIAQLLAFSRRQVLLPRVFDVGDLVEGMGGMLRALLGEDIDLLTERTELALLVNADPGRIEQVIMNLAVNARDAMPGGGSLSIGSSAALLGSDDLPGDMEVQPGEFVSLSVSDTGNGMDAATLERLFEPFFTTKEVGKGTGLGLATVYGIVRQSSGHITCRSEVGKGTTFTIFLPRARQAASAVEKGETPQTKPVRGTERILLVEDDESVRRYATSILESVGYTVHAADSGVHALEYLTALPEPPDLLLTDLILPGMGGRALAQEVARRSSRVRVMFMSGYAELSKGASGLEDVDTRLIKKPFSVVDLLRKVRAILESERSSEG
jgi:PAS domain S-box-containing protein